MWSLSWRNLREKASRFGPVTLLAVCVLWVSWPLLAGATLSHDHPMHLFKAWHFYYEMLGRGRVEGWTHFFAFGFPWGETVPVGPDAWVSLFRLLTFGQLSWLRTYSLAIAGVLMFSALANYALAARYFGKPAGAISGILLTFDPGAWGQGGWEWTVSYGVWPVSLGTACATMAFVRAERLIERGRASDLCSTSLWIAAALVAHHLALLLFAVGFPLLALDQVFRVPRARQGFWVPIGVALVIGVSLSAFFLLPMFARTAYTRDLGVMGVSLPELFVELATFTRFANVIPPIVVLGIGGALSLRTRAPGTLFCTLCVATFVLLSSNVLIGVLHLERAMPSLVKIEALRMIFAAKVFLFPLAAHAIVRIATLPLTEPVTGRARAVLQRGGALVMLAAPGAWAAFVPPSDALHEKVVEPAEASPYFRDLQAFWAFSRDVRAQTPGFYRIAYLLPMHEHVATIAPLFDGTPFYKAGYTPVQTFRSVTQTAELALLEALSVRYVVSVEETTNPALLFERKFGALFVYRMARFTGLPFTVIGPGEGRLLEFSPELIRIRLSHTARETRVKLHVANYPRWQAMLDGRELPILAAAALAHEYPVLMEVSAGDGELVFRYVRRTVDWLGMTFTLAGIAACAGLLVLGRSRRALSFEFLERRSPAMARGALGVGFAVLALLALAMRSRARVLPKDSLFQSLPAGAMTLGTDPCTPVEPLLYRCGRFSVGVEFVEGDYAGHLCMHVPESASHELSIRTAFLPRVFVHTQHPPGLRGTGSVRVLVDGVEQGKVATRDVLPGPESALFDLRDVPRTKYSKLEIRFEGAPLHCFDVRPSM